jgi:hypothetical protein
MPPRRKTLRLVDGVVLLDGEVEKMERVDLQEVSDGLPSYALEGRPIPPYIAENLGLQAGFHLS